MKKSLFSLSITLGVVMVLSAQVAPPVVVNLDRYGTLHVNQQGTEFAVLIEQLKGVAAAQPDLAVEIVAEDNVPFRDVVRIVDGVRSVGVTRVGIRMQKSAGTPNVQPPPGAIVLKLDRDRVVRLNGRRIDVRDVPQELQQRLKTRTDRSIFVQAHAGLSIDTVASVIDVAKAAGAGPIGLLSTED